MVNTEGLPATSFTSAFTAAGLDKTTYSPSFLATSLTSWPTLGSLIDAGTTLVVFMDTEADFSSVPYIIDEFSNMWEDAYGGLSVGSDRRPRLQEQMSRVLTGIARQIAPPVIQDRR